MGKYSIQDIARLTGIKAHTIRIWEKRYGVFTPERTDTNIRWYSDATLKRILKINILYNNGYKISKIAELSEGQINDIVDEISSLDENVYENHIEAMLASTVDMDEAEFLKVFGRLMKTNTFEEVVLRVFYPFFERLGMLWQIGTINPAQEHFVSNLIRQKILVALDGLPVPSSSKTVLLFLHEDELHELGLLFFNYLLREKGFRTLYLGQCVPYEDLVRVQKQHDLFAVVTSFVSPLEEGVFVEYSNKIQKLFEGSKIIFSGSAAGIHKHTLPKNICIADKSTDLLNLLD